MSVKVMSIVWEWETPLSAGERLVALALADHADDRGICWPGLEGVATKVGMTRRAVRRHVSALRQKEVLTVTSRQREDGSQASNLYQFCQGGVPELSYTSDSAVRGGRTAVSGAYVRTESSPESSEEEQAATFGEAGQKTTGATKQGNNLGCPPELENLELYRVDKKLCAAWLSLIAAASAAYPGVDLIAETRKAHAWEIANPALRKKNRAAFLNNWFKKELKEQPAVIGSLDESHFDGGTETYGI